MARLPRLTLPGYPHHVLQRGNNRQAIFTTPADQKYLLALLAASSKSFGVAIHAYVLMDNHFHLLATPQADGSLAQMMQAVGRDYVRYVNDAQGRSGTLWEGRYRSTVIDPEQQLLACMAYMDLNPVRHGIAAEASAYAWSSHAHYAGLRVDALLTPHPQWWLLGNTPFAREAAYAERVRQGISAAQEDAITASVLGGWALGDDKFMLALQKQTGRRVQKAEPGRPRLSRG